MMGLAEAAAVLGGRLQGADRTFQAVCHDSRALRAGDLFVALRGPRFDGHDFLAQAQDLGAAGALVETARPLALPQVVVADSRAALGRLAAHWRERFRIPLVAVTGSNGKTTVKEMIAAILGRLGPVLVTAGNRNNEIGVPLTLLGLRAGHQRAVVEMGMNHAGEIAYLSALARPTVALVTNAAEAHLEGLGSVAAVARAKGEIFGGLREGGVAVINADDPHAGLWRELAAPHEVVTFGLERPADYSADYQPLAEGSRLRLHTPLGEVDMTIPLMGRHNAANAAAAAACAAQAGAGLEDIRAGLERLRAVAGRLEVKRARRGAWVLDDSYNANPASVAAGLEVLRERAGERVLVLGDMLELGEAAAEIHRRVGALARRIGIQRLLAVGALARHAAEAFGPGGEHFPDHQALADRLDGLLGPRVTVLVKGSRGSHMEAVVAAVCSRGSEEGAA